MAFLEAASKQSERQLLLGTDLLAYGSQVPSLVGIWFASGVVGFLGLVTMLESEVVKYGTEISYGGRGYGAWQLIGLVAWMYLAPLMFAAGVSALLILQKRPGVDKSQHALVAAAWLGIAIAGAILAYYLLAANQLVACGVLWCFEESSDDSAALRITMGTLVFLAIVAFACISAILLVRVFFPPVSSAVGLDAETPQGADAGVQMHTLVEKAGQRYHFWRRVSAVGMLLAAPVTLIFIVGLLPDCFETFKRSSLKTWYAYTVGKDGSEISDTGDAWLQSFNWVWSDSVVVKFYPDTVTFYSILTGVVFAAILAAEFPAIRQFFSRKVERLGLALGHVLLGASFGVFFLLFAFYWAHDHYYHSDGKYNLCALEVFNRTCGLTASAIMGLLLLPASKGSPLLAACGVSWESVLWLHILLGNAFLFFACCHVFGFAARFVELGHWADILPLNWNFWYPQNPVGGTTPSDNYTVPMMSAIFWPALVCYGVFPWLRRKSYELFRFSHNIGLVLVPAAVFHGESCWYFVLPGAAIWCVDCALRFLQAAEPVEIKALTPLVMDCWTDESPELPSQNAAERITKVCFAWEGQSRIHSPGMYVMVNFPQISQAQWHPFSLSSSPLDAGASCHIKNMGDATFTGNLHELAKQTEAGAGVVMNVEGPYGPYQDMLEMERVLLVAGGIGVTPMISTLRFAVQCARAGRGGALRRLRLLWCARSPGVFDAFADELGLALTGAADTPLDVGLLLYCSAVPSAGRCFLGTYAAGAPQFPAVLAEEVAQGGGHIHVRVCGPPSMVAACEAAANDVGDAVEFEPWSFVI